MRENAELALQMAKGKTGADIEADRMMALALERTLEIIGEAATHVPDDIRVQLSSIPWRQVVGFRNIIVHRYDGLDYDLIANAVNTRLEPLISALDAYLGSEPRS
jgi:uncharacterized protein with HEPN domain